jgi:predicted dehydrogenase
VGKYTKFEDMLKDPSVEAVDLCLPTHLHAPLAIAALRAGKHVMVEKPMGLDGEECDRMIAEAQQAGKILMAAQVLRFWPSYVAMRETLPKLGAPRSALFRRKCAGPAWARWIRDKKLSGGGVFDLVIHDADMCVHLFGVPQLVSATGYEDLERGIDTVEASLYYNDGFVATISGGWHHPKSYPFSMEYTVVADGGTVDYSSAGREPTLYKAGGEAETLALPQTDGFEGEIAYFAKCATEGSQPEICKPQESAAAVRLTKLIDEARLKNGEKVLCQF